METFWNIDNSPEEFESAKIWTSTFLSGLNEGTEWLIPMAASTYKIYASQKRVVRLRGFGYGPLERVLLSLGWRIDANENKETKTA